MSTPTALLHPATQLEDKVAGLWLRERADGSWLPHSLTGGGEGQAGPLHWRATRTALEGREGWSRQVEVVNTGDREVRFDLVAVEDPSLSPAAVLDANRLYPSQYLDLTPVDLGERGTAVAIRQNMPGPRAPWALIGSWTSAVGWASDVTQLTGRGLPEGAPWPGLNADLPSSRLQQEHSAVALQSAPVTLAPGERWEGGIFVLLVDDHPAATSPADAARAEGLRPGRALPEVRESAASLVGRDTPGLSADDPSPEVLAALSPGERRHVEDLDGREVSWFTPEGDHVVTAAKQRAVPRPHGQILRPLTGLLPDPTDVTCTVWMDGGFCSHLTLGHAALGRILAAKETPLPIGRIHGVRIAVNEGDGWRLLGTPSAWRSGLDHATWIYASGERVIRVETRGPGADGAVAVSVHTSGGEPLPALVILALDWVGAPGATGGVSVTGETLTVAAPEGALLADASLTVDLPADAQVGGDEALFSDGVGRGEPVVTARVPALADWSLLLRPGVPGGTERGGSEGWADVHDRIAISAEGGAAATDEVARIDQACGWFAHDALVHYLSPRGLEQHTGGAWGTRDVSQGPVGLLRAWGEHAAWRDLLLIVFRAQHERGDWPQAFDFLPDYRRDEVADSHGDVVYWPLLALGQYLVATGDAGILAEPVAFTGDGAPGGEATLADHLRRALDAVEATFVTGTALPAYGHGDWNDSLQPASPDLARAMVSTWTVVLQAEALTVLAQGVGAAAPDIAERAAGIAERGTADLRRELLVDGVLAGYGVREDSGLRPLIHPRDTGTGLTYSVLAMIHAIAGDLLTPEEASRHLDLIAEHLTGPDGVRLFDRPVAYRGGPMEVFQRAEASTFFGREIGLMYMHAHLRYAEALARVGDGRGLLRALAQAVPIGIRDQVATATPRQANTYASSSDAAFADRYEAAADYHRVAAGEVALDGGWRVYSSGPGLFLEVLTQRMLGVRHAGAEVELDPVIDPDLRGLDAALPLLGGAVRVEIVAGPLGHGVASVHADGRPLATRALTNPYRAPGVAVAAEELRGAGVLRIVTG